MRRSLSVLALAGLATACGESNSSPSEATERTVVGRVDPTMAFTTEAYGIGASWYDYNETTHVLTPRDERYRVVSPGIDAALRVVTYYDADGTSGFFTVQLASIVDDVVGDWVELALSSNVKDAPVCVDLLGQQEVYCDSSSAHLVFRTERRVIPEAGFAVAEPGFYLHEPTLGRDADVFRVPIDAVTEEAAAVPDAWRVPADAILPAQLPDAVGYTVQQATRTGFAAQWTLDSAEANKTSTTLTLSVQCVEMATSADDQAAWGDPAEVIEIVIDTADVYAIGLCGDDGVTSTLLSPSIATWPGDEAVDVIVLSDDAGTPRLVIAPGSPAFLPSADARDRMHASLWDLR